MISKFALPWHMCLIVSMIAGLLIGIQGVTHEQILRGRVVREGTVEVLWCNSGSMGVRFEDGTETQTESPSVLLRYLAGTRHEAVKATQFASGAVTVVVEEDKGDDNGSKEEGN